MSSSAPAAAARAATTGGPSVPVKLDAADVGYGTAWLRGCGKEVSEAGSRVAELVNWWLRGIYHAQRDALRADWSGESVEFLHNHGGIATYDFSDLTRLVIGAHDAAIRVEISPGNPQLMRFRFHPRHRSIGLSFDRHPSIEDAIGALSKTRLPRYADDAPLEPVR